MGIVEGFLGPNGVNELQTRELLGTTIESDVETPEQIPSNTITEWRCPSCRNVIIMIKYRSVL